MKSFTAGLFFAFLLSGCVAMKGNNVVIEKLPEIIMLKAKTSYHPGGVGHQPGYTVNHGSEWVCEYKTADGDYVCCSKQSFFKASPWVYFLLADNEYNAFAYFELGENAYAMWPDGKQAIFEIVRQNPTESN
jgi:hypothetical protein